MSKNDFNATINLPKTDFPMRAGLAKREPEMLQRWYDMDLYHEMLKKNDGKPRFSLHDGPPFSNGDIHMGHALNKALKDFIVRSYAMRGYYTPYIPGWDNHGMPIESAIIKEQKLNHKAMSVADFRSACHDYAQKYIDRQMAGFKRMGVMGDWEHPYKTMNKGCLLYTSGPSGGRRRRCARGWRQCFRQWCSWWVVPPYFTTCPLDRPLPVTTISLPAHRALLSVLWATRQ